tara:strand:- start:514 stop:771 length:258 start_codon:yes stop_codon:yes gene_type:complete
MDLIKLPSLDDYMKAVKKAKFNGQITSTQLIILRICYKARKAEEPKHFNYFQKATSQTKEDCKWELNDLATKGAIRMIRPDFYML